MFYLNKLKGVKKNVFLAPYTTFKIGGPAKYFYKAKDGQDLIMAIKAVKKANVPFFIFGGGSNILVSDKGFDGLVIKIKRQKLKVKSDKVYADGGVLLIKLVNESLKAGLTGLEWLAGIPGTFGGAIQRKCRRIWLVNVKNR